MLIISGFEIPYSDDWVSYCFPAYELTLVESIEEELLLMDVLLRQNTILLYFRSHFDYDAVLVEFIDKGSLVWLIASQQFKLSFLADLLDVGLASLLRIGHKDSNLSIVLSFELNKFDYLAMSLLVNFP